MMIFKNETVTHRYFPEVNAATSVWYGFRKEKAYNEALDAMLNLIHERKVSTLVAVMNTESEFDETADEWTHEEWIRRAAQEGLRKIAVVAPEWTISDTAVNGVTVHYCKTFDEARQWVVGQAA